jgi:Outer membrane protein beta-barrel domain
MLQKQTKTTIMMKITIIFLLLTSTYFTKAQASFGGKAGINSYYKISNYNTSLYFYKHGIGFYIGSFANKKISNQVAVQLELLYLSQKDKALTNRYGYYVGLHPESDRYSTFTRNFINIPFLIQYNTKFGLYVETGPQLALIVPAKEHSVDTSVNTKKDFKAITLHWDFGIGYN